MLVTLLTDFGTADPYVAAMKGVILGIAPGAALVDITHEIPPQDVRSAAFTLLTIVPFFPAQTVHLAVVDPGVGSARRPLAASAGNQRFVGPDNGLFSYVLERAGDARVVQLTDTTLFRHPVSSTFHGRDIFAPVAAALLMGAPWVDLGPEVTDWIRLPALQPRSLTDGSVEAEIIHVDRFGNCVTSMHRDFLGAAEAGWIAKLGGREITSTHAFYAEAEAGKPFLIWGSAGFLEISISGASAAAWLGVRVGKRLRLRREPTEPPADRQNAG